MQTMLELNVKSKDVELKMNLKKMQIMLNNYVDIADKYPA